MNIELGQDIIELKESSSKAQVAGGPPVFEENIHRLQKKIVNLDNEKKALLERNLVLRAALLVHIDLGGADTGNLPMPEDLQEIIQSAESKKKTSGSQKETVDDIILSELKEISPIASEIINEDSTTQASEDIIETHGRRRKCPRCGNQDPKLIREVEDKTHIISEIGGLYSKKFVCRKCGIEWR